MRDSLKSLKVVIDPGHGGKESGAVGPTGLLEKEVNLEVAFILKRLFEDAGSTVVLTRDGDYSVGLVERVRIAKETGADLFLSLHHNSNSERNPEINRTEVYYPLPPYCSAFDLACYVVDEIATAKGIQALKPLPGRYRVLRDNVPLSLLIEFSYISNPDEEEKLFRIEYLRSEAEALFRAVRNYFDTGRPVIESFEIRDWSIHAKIVSSGSSPVDPTTITVFLNGIELPYTFDEKTGILKANFPHRMAQGDHRIELIARNLAGHRSDPFSYVYTVKRPAVSSTVSVLPPGGSRMLLVAVKLIDKFGSPVFAGERVEVVSDTCRILEATNYTNEKGEVYALVELDREQGLLEFSSRDFSTAVQLKYLARATYLSGRVIDAATGRGIEECAVRWGNAVKQTLFGGFFYFDRRFDGQEIVVKKAGYKPFCGKVREEDDFILIELTPLFNGYMQGVMVQIDPEENLRPFGISLKVAELIGDMVKIAGGYISMPEVPLASDKVLRLLKNSEILPDYVIILRRSDRFAIGFYELDPDSQAFAHRLCRNLKKLNFELDEPKPVTDYLLIHYSGKRIILELCEEMLHDAYLQRKVAYAVFSSILQDLGFKGREIKGEIVDEDGKPVEHAWIKTGEGICLPSDENGEFQLLHLPRGEACFTLEKDGHRLDFYINSKMQSPLKIVFPQKEGGDGTQGCENRET